MKEMKSYYFKEEPFQEGAYIDPEINNDRLNGKVFSIDGFKKPYQELLELIQKNKSICYLTSGDESRGTGKSAILSAVYWKLKNDEDLSKQYEPVWVSLHDAMNVTQIIGRALDSFVNSGIIAKIEEKIQDNTIENIKKAIEPFRPSPNPSALLAISKLLSVPKEQLSWKYVNIKRSFPTTGVFEIFEYLLHLKSSIDPRRLILFIDQFEEYLEEQSYSAKNLQKISSNLRDIYRTSNATKNVTFVLTIHPKTQKIFENAASEILSSYGQVSENAAFMDEINEKHLIKIALKYMEYYRMKNTPTSIDEYFPFKPDVLEYLAKISNGNPRKLLRFCYNTLLEAAYQEKNIINMEFIKANHQKLGLGVFDITK